MTNEERIRQLAQNGDLPAGDMKALLTTLTAEEEQMLYQEADQIRRKYYGTDVYLRGLIEFTNYCKNDCYYCGLRRGNTKCDRYRLNREEILQCADAGYELGFRTIVMQGGEDPYFTDEMICDLVSSIKKKYPDCAVTLSIGEKERESYQAYYDAGADRYLLRHETVNPNHYAVLHPSELSAEHRQQCLRDLKDIGFQIGCGIMVGAPGQTADYIVEDLKYMKALEPHMVGIGPFIPHQDTPFYDQPAGTLTDTLHLLGIIRLMLPKVLLPATTALGTIHPQGREMGVRAGANVIMPNLSPSDVRGKYLLYDGKISTGDEAAESCYQMKRRMEAIGYQVVQTRGDHVDKTLG